MAGQENEELRAPGMTIRCHRCLRVVNRDEGDGKEQRWRWTGDDEDRECLCVDCDPEGVAADEALNVERTEARKAWLEQLQAKVAATDKWLREGHCIQIWDGTVEAHVIDPRTGKCRCGYVGQARYDALTESTGGE